MFWEGRGIPSHLCPLISHLWHWPRKLFLRGQAAEGVEPPLTDRWWSREGGASRIDGPQMRMADRPSWPLPHTFHSIMRSVVLVPAGGQATGDEVKEGSLWRYNSFVLRVPLLLISPWAVFNMRNERILTSGSAEVKCPQSENVCLHIIAGAEIAIHIKNVIACDQSYSRSGGSHVFQ